MALDLPPTSDLAREQWDECPLCLIASRPVQTVIELFEATEAGLPADLLAPHPSAALIDGWRMFHRETGRVRAEVARIEAAAAKRRAASAAAAGRRP